MSQFDPSLIQTIRQARSIVVLTGAGISAESGVPTFREAQTGLWEKYDPQQLATPEAFERNPKLVWEWYQWRRKIVEKAVPNPGHFALAELEQQVTHFMLITQNVDGLHQRAGSRSVVELHGRINRYKCAAGDGITSQWDENYTPPRCLKCGANIRPDVVWFGEGLPHQALDNAIMATQKCDLFFSIGTSALVQPAASLPLVALENNIPTVEINPQPTPLSHFMKYTLPYAAGKILPELLRVTFRGP